VTSCAEGDRATDLRCCGTDCSYPDRGVSLPSLTYYHRNWNQAAAIDFLRFQILHSLSFYRVFFFPTRPIGTGPTLYWVFIRLSEGYYHCDRLSCLSVRQVKKHPVSWRESSPYDIPFKHGRGGEVWLCSFFNRGARWGWVVNPTPRPFCYFVECWMACSVTGSYQPFCRSQTCSICGGQSGRGWFLHFSQ
jgi:hypothetical protein